MSYFCAYHSFLETIEPLSDAERGRLFTACLEYSRTGKTPDLSGNERFIFPSIKSQIDRDNAKYEDRRQKASESANTRWRREAMRTHANAYERMRPNANDAIEKEKEIIKEKELPNGSSKEKRPKPFLPPTLDQLQEYAKEANLKIDCERFIDFYKAKDWMIGKNKMKDWKAAARNWARPSTTERTRGGIAPKKLEDRHNYDYAKIEEEMFGEG